MLIGSNSRNVYVLCDWWSLAITHLALVVPFSSQLDSRLIILTTVHFTFSIRRFLVSEVPRVN